MAIILILLLIGYFSGREVYYLSAIPVVVINMAYPRIFYPFAVIWLGFSKVVGELMSTILLSLVYVLLVIPIGSIRLLLRKDSLGLKSFGKGEASLMKIRNHTYTHEDLEKPY